MTDSVDGPEDLRRKVGDLSNRVARLGRADGGGGPEPGEGNAKAEAGGQPGAVRGRLGQERGQGGADDDGEIGE